MTVFKRQNTETLSEHRRQPPWSAIFRAMNALRDVGVSSRETYRFLNVAALKVSTDENGDAVFRSTSASEAGPGRVPLSEAEKLLVTVQPPTRNAD
jgi:hypothetical protein